MLRRRDWGEFQTHLRRNMINSFLAGLCLVALLVGLVEVLVGAVV